MKTCPACKTENNGEARFCKQCGSPFPQGEKSGSDNPDDSETLVPKLDSAPSAKDNSLSPSGGVKRLDKNGADSDDAASTGNIHADSSEKPNRGHAFPEAQSESVEDAEKPSKAAAGTNPNTAFNSPLQKNDALSSKRLGLREKWDGLSKGKRYAVIGGLAAIIVLVIVVVATVTAGPSSSQVESEFKQDVNLKVDDTWGDGGDYKIDSFKITGKDKTDVNNILYKGEVWHVTVEANLSNDIANADGTWSADYIKSGNNWVSLAGFSVESISYTPNSGVDEDNVIAHASSIFDPYGSVGRNSTTTNVSYSISDHQTNGTQDTLTITKKEETDFSTVTTTASCVFTFNGSWTYDSSKTKVNPSATDFSQLKGTWQGKFCDMSSVTLSSDGECKGGVKNPAVLKIDSVDSDGTVTGSISVLAHIHPKVKSDVESSDGDQMVDIPIKSHLGSNFGQYENGNAIVVSTVKDDDNISVSIGTATENDKMQLVATVTNNYSYTNEHSLHATLYYKEVYVLTKQ